MNSLRVAEWAERSSARITTVDLGAYNTRFGLVESGRLCNVQRSFTSPSADITPSDAFRSRLTQRVRTDKPDAVVIAAAGPVSDAGVSFTNVDLTVVGAEVRQIVADNCGEVPVIIANDGLCGAAGLVTLPDELLWQFNGVPTKLWEFDEITVVILGSGMAVAKLTRVNGVWTVKATELGHLWLRRGMSGYVDQWLYNAFGGAVELEHMVSGLGLVNGMQALIDSTPHGMEAKVLLDQVPSHDQARFIAVQSQLTDGHSLFRDAMSNFRRALGFAISALGMDLTPAVIGGRPVSANLDYLLEGVEGGVSPLQAAMRDRRNLGQVATTMAAYAIQQDETDADRNELNLLGAGAIGLQALHEVA
jgi:glucokinase